MPVAVPLRSAKIMGPSPLILWKHLRHQLRQWNLIALIMGLSPLIV